MSEQEEVVCNSDFSPHRETDGPQFSPDSPENGSDNWMCNSVKGMKGRTFSAETCQEESKLNSHKCSAEKDQNPHETLRAVEMLFNVR